MTWVPDDALIKSIEPCAMMISDFPMIDVVFYRRVGTADDGGALYSREPETATVEGASEIRRIADQALK